MGVSKNILIDEISMLDNVLFDKLSTIGKIVRKNDNPFGGVQLVACGDFLQLLPVGVGSYGKDFAFMAQAWRDMDMKTKTLSNVIRQKGDDQFVQVLNEVRLGKFSNNAKELFHNCHINNKPLPNDGILPTQLFCKNKGVDDENRKRLNQLEGEMKEFDCTDYIFQVEDKNIKKQLLRQADKRIAKILNLKIGAQVVLLRNLNRDGLVNGQRGVVEEFVYQKLDGW